MKKAVCIFISIWIIVFVTQEITHSKKAYTNAIQTESTNSTDIKNFNNIDKENLSPDIKSIIDRGKLRVAMVGGERPGFCYHDQNGELRGVDVNLAEGIAEALGVDLEIDQSTDTYDNLANRIIERSVDLIISEYSESPKRSMYLTQSDPYLKVRFGLMANKSELAKNNIEKNPLMFIKENKVKVGVLKGSSHVRTAYALFENSDIVEMDSYEELISKVLNGELFAYFCSEDEFVYDYISNADLLLYTKVFVFSDAYDNYCVGIHNDCTGLLRFVNSYIDLMDRVTIYDVEKEINRQ